MQVRYSGVYSCIMCYLAYLVCIDKCEINSASLAELVNSPVSFTDVGFTEFNTVQVLCRHSC